MSTYTRTPVPGSEVSRLRCPADLNLRGGLIFLSLGIMSTKLVRAFVFAVSITSVTGCMTILIEGSGDRDKTPSAQKVEETIHGSFWGFRWAKQDVSKCETNHELYRIKYHQNALFILTSVATLGLYVPQSVEWWCVVREDSSIEEGSSLKLKKRPIN